MAKSIPVTQTISIIRRRGQLTIPDSIRDEVSWVNPLSPVTVTLVNSEEIAIRPHQPQKKVDWEKLWKQLRRVRSFKGRGGGNLSAFIVKDRETHF